MSGIDLSPEALKKRREIAEKATPGPWIDKSSEHGARFWLGREEDVMDVALTFTEENHAHIAANSPDAVIAMIDEIERLRSVETFRKDFLTLMDTRRLHAENERLEKERDWLADKLSEYGMDRKSPPDMDGDEWLLYASEAVDGQDANNV